MSRNRVQLAAVAALSLSVFPPTHAAPSVNEAMQSVQYLVGTWNCAHTVGNFSGTYVMSYTKSIGDRWLKQTWDFPATATEPAVHSEYFLGFDPRFPAWVRFGAHTNGQYYAMRTTSVGSDRWSWQYILPGPSGSATWTKRSDTEYAVDGPEYPQDGKLVTEHHVCKKLP
jgi:hypothetical protein